MIGRLARILLVFLLALPAAARAETRALVVAASYAGSGNSAAGAGFEEMVDWV